MREVVESVRSNPRVRSAVAFLVDKEPAIEEEQVQLSLIPAPPFEESARAQEFAERLRGIGFRPVTDAIGNVVASFEGFGPNPVVVGAHLDTVFPAATPLRLRRRGRTIHLPGISDNGAGLVAILWILRAARSAGIRFGRPVIAVGNVGEEGQGNLRGIRHLFNAPPWEGRDCDFIAVDGGGEQRIIDRGLGSRRFRVRMTGPGGHSWADFGRPHPIHALASTIHRFEELAAALPAASTYSVGTIGGGFSVNSIPNEASMDVDLRSTDRSNMELIEQWLRRASTESSTRHRTGLSIELLGERPAGGTPERSPLLQAAMAVTRACSGDVMLDVGSTDANIPMSLGIPAIAIGGGGSAGSVHTTDEWFDPTRRSTGLERLLVLVAVMAGLK